MNLLDGFELSLDHITSGVMGDPNLISQGRYFRIKYTVCGLEYSTLVLDVDQSPDCPYSWQVFYATQVSCYSLRILHQPPAPETFYKYILWCRVT